MGHDHHQHDHDHAHVHEASESNLKRVMIALVLTGTFMFVEVVGGILSGSLALLADAGHMLTDTMALALAAAAFHVSKRPPGGSLTYGYQRFQILAAFVNGLSLLFIVGWILYEAVERFIYPRDILGDNEHCFAENVTGIDESLHGFIENPADDKQQAETVDECR